MKISLITCLTSVALALSVFGQTPTPPDAAAASPTASAAPASPSATITATPAEDDLDAAIKKKVRHHLGVSVGGHAQKDITFGDSDHDSAAWMAVPIVIVIFTTLFGAPVLVVATILFFSYLKSRALHRTVRMMVEKGQPVPPELFATPGSPAKVRSDLRRGIVLTTIGLGLIIFLAAVNGGFRGGEWAVGVIPLMIGAGYLLVWKLEGTKPLSPPVR